jgi:hypothetical protein
MSVATEATRTSSMFSYKNLVFDPDCRIYSSNESTRYPASNLFSPIRGKPFKSLTSDKCSIIVDLGGRNTIDYVQAICLVDTNLVSGSVVRLKASNDRGTIDVSPDAYWDIQIWTVQNGVFVFVLGTPSSGKFDDRKYRFWQLDLPANGGGSGVQHSLGILWLGKIFQYGFDRKLDFKMSTNMDMSKLVTGGKQSSFIDTVYEFDFEIIGLSTSDAYQFKYDLETMNINRYILVDYFSFSNDTSKRAHGVFYGSMDKGSIAFKAGAPKLVDVTFNFNEMPQSVT